MAFRFNPLSGQLEIDRSATTVEFAEKISAEFDCDISAVIGDVVVPSTITENKVESLSSNTYSNLAFGIIIKKITTTTCEVLISGKLTDGFSGLAFGKPIYVGTDGKVTTTVPTINSLQKIGLAIKSDEIFLLPSLEKVILS